MKAEKGQKDSEDPSHDQAVAVHLNWQALISHEVTLEEQIHLMWEGRSTSVYVPPYTHLHRLSFFASN